MVSRSSWAKIITIISMALPMGESVSNFSIVLVKLTACRWNTSITLAKSSTERLMRSSR